MSNSNRTVHMAVALSLSFFLAAPGQAQQGSVETSGLEEVVVTARKRTESLQAVPVA